MEKWSLWLAAVDEKSEEHQNFNDSPSIYGCKLEIQPTPLPNPTHSLMTSFRISYGGQTQRLRSLMIVGSSL